MSIRSTSYLFTFFLTIAIGLGAYAQILTPATWQVSWSNEDVKVGEEVDVIFTVAIDKDWYLYSTDFDPDLGPMVTEFTFEPGSGCHAVVISCCPYHVGSGHDKPTRPFH